MARGKLILLIGPTGSGKGTLIRHAVEQFPNVRLLNSYTTRPRRPDSVENNHYQFVSREEFEKMIERGEFLEWEEFSGNYYATPKRDVEEGIEKGLILMKEMDVRGARQAKKLLPPEDVLTVFINGGSWEELAARAMKRAPMAKDELARRKLRYDDEIPFISEADVVIHNGKGQREQADRAFEETIRNALDSR